MMVDDCVKVRWDCKCGYEFKVSILDLNCSVPVNDLHLWGLA